MQFLVQRVTGAAGSIQGLERADRALPDFRRRANSGAERCGRSPPVMDRRRDRTAEPRYGSNDASQSPDRCAAFDLSGP